MPFRLRPATSSELPLLGAIHQSAISTFAQIPDLTPECSLPPLPLELLETFEVVLAVHVDHDNAPTATPRPRDGGAEAVQAAPPAGPEQIKGFVALRLLDASVFIAMICVREADQRVGVGTALLAHAAAGAKRRGYSVVSLTTFRDVPGNGKWYRQMGFPELADDQVEGRLGPEHMAMLRKSRAKHEREGSTWRGVVMARCGIRSFSQLPRTCSISRMRHNSLAHPLSISFSLIPKRVPANAALALSAGNHPRRRALDRW